jgi:hypothetical protein
MRRSSLVLVAVTLLAVFGTSFYSQGQPQNQPPRPARSRADETLAMWNSIGNKLIAMAQDFPEDKYDFKVQKDQRTFAQTLLHVAGVDYLLMRTVSGSNIGPDLGKDVVNPSRDEGRRRESDSAGSRGRSEPDSTAGRRGTGRNDEISVWEQAGPQFLQLDVRHRGQRRALRPARGVLSRQQHGAAGIAAAIRPLKVLD